MARIALLVLVALALGGCSRSELIDAPDKPPSRACVTSREVVPVGFSATKYPNIRRHYERAVAAGWPAVLELNRAGSDRRRDRLLGRSSSRPGQDRDEYPPAVGRASVRASIAFVPSSENRSHGATLGTKLRRFCNGTRFRYVFY